MKAYKGFRKMSDGKLMCRDMEYEPGKTYKHDGEIALCKSGFHACHNLHQTWQFYPNNGNNVFYEVECGGEIIESEEGDGKFVCSEITLLKEVDMSHVQTFDEGYGFFEGFAMVVLNGKRNFISTEGRLLSEQWFDYVCRFCEGFAKVEINGNWNFISTEGKLLSEQWFDYAYTFFKGFALVRLDDKYNYINIEGKLLSEQWFDYVSYFSEGFARVVLDGEAKKINKKGEIV